MNKKIIVSMLMLSMYSFHSQSATDDGFKSFLDCSKREAIKYAPLPDPADVIAKAAVFSCANLAYDYLKKDESFNLMTPANQSIAVDRLTAAVEPAAMKAALDFRLSKLQK